MKTWLCYALVTVSGLSPDACNSLNSTSFCMDSGFCSNTRNQLSCRDAYIRRSENLLIPNSQVPIIFHPIGTDEVVQSVIDYTRGELEPPSVDEFVSPTITAHPYHVSLIHALSRISKTLGENFPFLHYHDNTQLVYLIVVARVIQSQPELFNEVYRRSLMNNSWMKSIRTQIRIYIEHISSLSRTDLLRKSIFANLVPFVHAWVRFHNMLALPSPVMPIEYLNFLTTAAQFDPLYETSESKKVWVIGLPAAARTVMTIPFIDLHSAVPLPVLDYFDFEESTLNITTAVDRVIEKSRNLSSIPDLLMSVMFMQYHPSVTDTHRTLYCASFSGMPTQSRTGDFGEFQIISGMLDMSRICGDRGHPLPDRIDWILPIVLRRANLSNHYRIPNGREFEYLSDIPISALRQRIRVMSIDESSFDTDTLLHSHVAYLSHFLEAHSHTLPLIASDTVLDAHQKSIVESLGVVSALLLIEGDPTGILGSRFARFLFNSISFRTGFCKVINCIAFETLFRPSEISILLDHLRTRSRPYVS